MEDGDANAVLTVDSKLYILKTLIEKLTGKKITLLDASPMDQEAVCPDLDPEQVAPPSKPSADYSRSVIRALARQ
jgi:hypothetical protein